MTTPRAWLSPPVRFHSRRARFHLEQIVQRWRRCDACPLHERRSRVVHLRGSAPCDILFIGEAPGHSEDGVGYPFTGDCGRFVLEPLLADAWTRLGREPPWAVANIVGCLPELATTRLDGAVDWTLRPPTKAEATACRPRLLELLVDVCRPRALVLLGRVAQRYGRALPVRLPPEAGGGAFAVLDLPHPAAILRRGGKRGATSCLEFRRAALRLAFWLREHGFA